MVSWLKSLSCLILFATIVAGCGQDDSDSSERVCIPGASVACICEDGRSGAQVCNAEGAALEACVCGGSVDDAADTSTDTASDVENTPDVEQDTMNDAATEDADAGSADDVSPDVDDTDAVVPDTVETDVAPDVAVDPCADVPVYVASVPNQSSQWAFMGEIGLEAGNAMCRAAAEAAGVVDSSGVTVCEYVQVLEADARGEFAAFTATDSAWLWRTTVATVFGSPSNPGAGGNCNNFTCSSCDHIADGEFVQFGDGVVASYEIDNDTFFDGLPGSSTQPGLLQCGGVIRQILCCNPLCVAD